MNTALEDTAALTAFVVYVNQNVPGSFICVTTGGYKKTQATQVIYRLLLF